MRSVQLNSIAASVSNGLDAANSTSFLSENNSSVDLNAVLNASLSLSQATQSHDIFDQLIQTILDISGGDTCILLLPSVEGEWQVRVTATSNAIELCEKSFEGETDIPVELIQYVRHTQETVVVDDLNTDLPLIGKYLHQHQPKSALGLPILNQGCLMGILYLGNQSASGVFTDDLILVLNFLCTQAAISLENARLYQLEQEKNELCRHQKFASKLSLTEQQIQFLLLGTEGFIDCNQATGRTIWLCR